MAEERPHLIAAPGQARELIGNSARSTVVSVLGETIPAVAESETIYLLNNFLQGGIGVRASEYLRPVEDGAAGLLVIECLVADEYEEATAYLHEPHGTLLRRSGFGDDYVFAVADDAALDASFPQQVTFNLEWRHITD